MIDGQAVRPATRRESGALPIGLRPNSLGGYAIMLVLAFFYAIPLMFVLFVALESPRQFATNAASIPDPAMWSNFPNAWVRGQFGSYFFNTVSYTLSPPMARMTSLGQCWVASLRSILDGPRSHPQDGIWPTRAYLVSASLT